MREREKAIPADETLFHGLIAKAVDGDRVVPGSISLPCPSFNREYAGEASPRAVDPTWTGTAALRAGDAPGPWKMGQHEYRWTPHDDPLEENEAHAEVRLHRASDTSDKPFKVKKPGQRDAARTKLAEQMRVVIAPEPAEDPVS